MYDLHVPKNNFTIVHTIHFFFEAERRIISFSKRYIMTDLNII